MDRFKVTQRAKLRPKLHKVCKCRGKIVCNSRVWGSFGINNDNNKRILLSNVSVEDVLIDHVWVKSKELNDKRKYHQGIEIIFDAFVNSYQKINGAVGLGLFDLKNIDERKVFKNLKSEL